MPLRNDILTPVPGENPAGQDLRYAPVYEKIREARREDDQLSQGAWQYERKLADHGLAIRLAQDAITTQSKDLQLAAWVTESLAIEEAFGGLLEGLALCRGLIEQFWDNLYPIIDEGDLEPRSALLEWLAGKLELRARMSPLCREGYGLLAYKIRGGSSRG
jgi:type VI secretion system protein ImpA